MIKKLIDAIAQSLDSEFKDYEVYDENPIQGLIEPCFLITLVNPTNTHYKNNRYKRTHLFNIQYFPIKGKKECYDINDRLFLILRHIEDLEGTTYEGSNMNGEVQGGVLNFFVNYDFYVDLDVPEIDPISDFDLNQTARR